MAGVCWDEVLTAVGSRITGLGLTGITAVAVQLVGDDEGGDGPTVAGYPAVIVSGSGQAETVESVTNLRDDVTYPVAVVVIANENRDKSTNRERNLGWRQSIRRAFSQQRLSGITGGVAWKCEVRPGTVADRPKWLQNQHAQLLIVAVTVRETRG